MRRDCTAPRCAAPVTLVSPLLSSLILSLSLSHTFSLSRTRVLAPFLEIPPRSTASLRLLPFGSLGDTARSKHALHCRNFCVSSRWDPRDQSLARLRCFLSAWDVSGSQVESGSEAEDILSNTEISILRNNLAKCHWSLWRSSRSYAYFWSIYHC